MKLVFKIYLKFHLEMDLKIELITVNSALGKTARN